MVIVTILGIHGACASGIPVVDGALNGLMQFETQQSQQHRLSTVAQWAKDIAHYAAVIQNWKDNFKNQIRNQLMNSLGIELKTDKVDFDEVIKLLEKKKSDCNRITNLKSQQYCKEMIILEQDKIKHSKQTLKEIQEHWINYQNLVKNYNSEQQKQIAGAKNEGSANAANSNIQHQLQAIATSMEAYEKETKLFDQRIETLRKARIQIAQEQMKGTNLVTAVAKGGVVAKLKSETKEYIKEGGRIEKQRENVSERSQEAFSKGTTTVKIMHQEY